MLLSEYIKELQKLVEESPEALDMEVVYAKDDEGNGFQTVSCTPCVGNYDGEQWGEFQPEEYLAEDGEEGYELNAVCIN